MGKINRVVIMKKIFTCFLALCPMVASADYLDDKIASLTKEKLEKLQSWKNAKRIPRD